MSIRLFLIFAFVIVFGFIHVFVTSDSLATNKRLPDITPLNFPKIEITSHRNGDYVYPSSELTIKGTSSDTGKTNCTIYTSINNIQPFQNASATGSQGEQDFSNWNSTFFNATNLLRLGKNTITSLIVCLDANHNSSTSSSHLINLTGVRSDNNQSIIMSSASRVIHDDLENKTVGQHKNSDQSTTNLNNLHTRPIHNNNDQSQSQSQSTLSPNSGQSTTGNP